MRFVRIGVVLAFIAVVAVAIVLRFTKVEDKTMPVIKCSQEELSAECSATDEELLSYVTAYDAKDGELTDRIIVESISKFVEIGTAKVTYAVCDSDNNVAKLTKIIKYTDYRHPQILLNSSLSFSVEDKANDLLTGMSAYDVFDGYVNQKLTVVASDFDGTVAGKYPVTFKVSNSMGDYYITTFNAYVHSAEYTQEIKLVKNTEYLKVGDTYNARAHISQVIDIESGRESAEYSADDVAIDASGLDMSKPGVYDIIYTITNPKNHRVVAWARTNVVCEEK